MRWFKHDSDAHRDAKLRKVVRKYGMEGYGLYWHCIELIVSNLSTENLTFELEHDAELISDDTGIHQERVQEMMTFMVDLGLFENSGGIITCLKIAKRLDQSMTSSPEMRRLLAQIRDKHDGVMTQSCKTRPDQTRPDQKKKKTPLPADFQISDRVRKWATEKGHARLGEHLEAFKAKAKAKGYKYVDWDSAFMEAIRNNWANLPVDTKPKRYADASPY